VPQTEEELKRFVQHSSVKSKEDGLKRISAVMGGFIQALDTQQVGMKWLFQKRKRKTTTTTTPRLLLSQFCASLHRRVQFLDCLSLVSSCIVCPSMPFMKMLHCCHQSTERQGEGEEEGPQTRTAESSVGIGRELCRGLGVHVQGAETLFLQVQVTSASSNAFASKKLFGTIVKQVSAQEMLHFWKDGEDCPTQAPAIVHSSENEKTFQKLMRLSLERNSAYLGTMASNPLESFLLMPVPFHPSVAICKTLSLCDLGSSSSASSIDRSLFGLDSRIIGLSNNLFPAEADGDKDASQEVALGDVERTRSLLDQSLKSYRLNMRFSKPQQRNPPIAPKPVADPLETATAAKGHHHAAAEYFGAARGGLEDVMSSSQLELSTYYNTSESGLQPYPVVQKIMRNVFKVFAASSALERVHASCRELFISRKEMRSKYEKGSGAASKGMKLREYITQILLRLEAASQAVKHSIGGEEVFLTKSCLKEIRLLLNDIMFQLPGKVVGAGAKEFLESVIYPAYSCVLKNSIRDLYKSFGLKFEEKGKTGGGLLEKKLKNAIKSTKRKHSSSAVKKKQGRARTNDSHSKQDLQNPSKKVCTDKDKEERLDPLSQSGGYSSLMMDRGNLRNSMNLMRKVCIKINRQRRTKTTSKPAAPRASHALLSDVYNKASDVVEDTPLVKRAKKPSSRVVMETPFQLQRVESQSQVTNEDGLSYHADNAFPSEGKQGTAARLPSQRSLRNLFSSLEETADKEA
jgi:hypothetical protein